MAINRAIGKERLERRTIFANVGKDRSLASFLFGEVKDRSKPPIEFRCFFFWDRLLSNSGSKQLLSLKKSLEKPLLIKLSDYNSKMVKKYKESVDMPEGEKKTEEIKRLFPGLAIWDTKAANEDAS